MENILEGLNKEQLEAAKTTQGALLILAGAGSGKTKVLTSRIAYMIQNGAIAGKILAVTFTNKAAKEMKERLSKMLGENIVKYMWVGTFHSICGRILRQDIERTKCRTRIHLQLLRAILNHKRLPKFLNSMKTRLITIMQSTLMIC